MWQEIIWWITLAMLWGLIVVDLCTLVMNIRSYRKYAKMRDKYYEEYWKVLRLLGREEFTDEEIEVNTNEFQD